jgi:hypothetical protein
MARGVLVAIGLWMIISFSLYVFGHLTSNEKTSVIKCLTYGLVTAIIAVAVIVGMVFVF